MKKWFSVLACGALALSTWSVAGVATADEIDGAITSVEVSEDSAAVWENLTVEMTWAVPDSARGGDTFTLTLPAQLGNLPAGFDLLDTDGKVVAKAEISDDSPALVTFTLTEFADTRTGVNGGATFSAKAADESYAGQTEDLTFTSNDGTTFDDTVTFDQIGEPTPPRKFGYFTDSSDQCRTATEGCLNWVIEGPTGSDTLTITDTVKDGYGWTFDCDDVTVQYADYSASPDSYTSVEDADVDIDCDANSLTITVDNIPAGLGVRVDVKASTDLAGGPGDVAYENEASFSGTGPGEPVVVTGVAQSGFARGYGEGVLPPPPAITIVKDDEDGHAADTADDAVDLGPAPGATGLVFTITNSGGEPLTDVEVSDDLVANGTIDDLVCTFPDDKTGTSWAGPFPIGASFTCTADLSGVQSGAAHENVASVTAIGQTSGTEVEDDNPYFATATPAPSPTPTPTPSPSESTPPPSPTPSHTPSHTATPVPPAPVQPPTPPLADTGSPVGPWALGIGALLVAAGAAVLVARRRFTS